MTTPFLTRSLVLLSSLACIGSASARMMTTPVESFSDISPGHPNYEAINFLRENNIVEGYPDGTFKPDRRLNRAEFVKIAINPFNISGVRVNDCIPENFKQTSNTIFFSDVLRDDWFAPYVCAAKVSSIVDGYPDRTFKPAEYISFVEAGKILTGIFIGNLAKEDPWYKPYVMQLGEHNAIPTTIDSFSQQITRGEMAEMIYRLKTDNKTKISETYNSLQ